MARTASAPAPTPGAAQTKDVRVVATAIGWYGNQRRFPMEHPRGKEFIYRAPIKDGVPQLPSWCITVTEYRARKKAEEAAAEAAEVAELDGEDDGAASRVLTGVI